MYRIKPLKYRFKASKNYYQKEETEIAREKEDRKKEG